MPSTVPASRLVYRERVQKRIVDAAAHPVTFIIAPAGFGKSVALSHYLESLQDAWIRYNVRPEHGSLLGFVRGFCGAVSLRVPGTLEALEAKATEAQGRPDVVDVLAAWMASHVEPFHGTIALDDFQNAGPDERAMLFLRTLIERTMPRIQWIIASRSAKGLPHGTWFAEGTVGGTIDEDALRFEIEDAIEASRVVQPELPEVFVRRLHSLTSGWATAFGFALRVYRDGAGIEEVGVDARQLSYEYLAEQVYVALSQKERDLLRFGAMLPSFDVDWLSAAGFDDAEGILRGLYERSTFLSLDAENASHVTPRRYRCHDLFRDFLESQSALLGQSALRALRVEAARVLEASGEFAAALRAYALAEAHEGVVTLLRRRGFTLLDHAESDTVRFALDRLPKELFNGHSAALAMRAKLEGRADGFARARKLYERAIELTDDPGERENIRYQLAICCWNGGNYTEAIERLELVFNSEDSSKETRCKALSALAYGYAFERPLMETCALLEDAEEFEASVESDEVRADLLISIAYSANIIGDDAKARRTLRSATSIVERGGAPTVLRGHLARVQAMFSLWREDDAVRALEHVVLAEQSYRQLGAIATNYATALCRLYVATRLGDAESLGKTLQICAELRPDDCANDAVVQAKAFLAAWSGDLQLAADLMDQATGSAFGVVQSTLAGLCAILRAAIGQSQEVARMLTVAAELELKEGNSSDSIRRFSQLSRYLCVAAQSIDGRVEDARRRLVGTTAPRSEVEKGLREFALATLQSPASRYTAGLFEPSLDQLSAAQYKGYAKLLKSVIASVIGNATEASLTPTETKILSALAEGHAPREIADMTFSSVHTVRTHIKRILVKLGCSGRDHAIRVARARRII